MPAEAITQPEVKATPTEVAPAAVVQPPAVTPPAVVPPAEEPQKAPEKAADTKPEDKPAEVFNLKIPEGKEVDSEMLGAFSTTAQQLGIANEQAQKLLDTMSPVIESRLQQKMLDAQTATVDAWGQQLAEDPVLGGRNLERTINAANAALKHPEVGTPELKQLLVDTGLANHREIARLFAWIQSRLAPDQIVRGHAPGSQNDQRAQLSARYPTTPPV